jgi:hypothetical protein
MLATGLAVAACQQGRRVRFTTLAGLATELQEAESRRELQRVVGRYARTELVVLDELGCAPRGAIRPGGMRRPTPGRRNGREKLGAARLPRWGCRVGAAPTT